MRRGGGGTGRWKGRWLTGAASAGARRGLPVGWVGARPRRVDAVSDTRTLHAPAAQTCKHWRRLRGVTTRADVGAREGSIRSGADRGGTNRIRSGVSRRPRGRPGKGRRRSGSRSMAFAVGSVPPPIRAVPPPPHTYIYHPHHAPQPHQHPPALALCHLHSRTLTSLRILTSRHYRYYYD